MGCLSKEDIMSTIKTMRSRGASSSEISGYVKLSPGTVRHHVRRLESGATDGRRRSRSKAMAHSEAISHWRESCGEMGSYNLVALHAFLVREHGYDGSLRSVQRYWRRKHGEAKVRSFRRFETPAGVQAQVDWAEFRGVEVGGELVTLYALHVVLSHSRKEAIVWSRRKNMVSWQRCHVRCFERLGGVPAVARVDNEKTAVSRGAGSWGEINPTYRRFAKHLTFHVDACPPRQPQMKGKVERLVREQRGGIDPRSRSFRTLEELQAWTDAGLEADSRKRICPPTGTTVAEAWLSEKRLLTPLPHPLPEPFDVAVLRKVGKDCLVSFEGGQFSVPYRFVGLNVEVRGTATSVQVASSGEIVAKHPRGGLARLHVDDSHYDAGEVPDARVIAPPPLGKMGERIRSIASAPVERRSIAHYDALMEVAR